MFLDNKEAIIFRLLTAFFGQDQVIPQMSVLAACGGKLPKAYSDNLSWAKNSKCLFTIVNEDDSPRLIVELGVDNKEFIDLVELEKQQQLKLILSMAGIRYIIISKSDFNFITDLEGPDNWYFFLKDQFEHLLQEA